MVVAGNFSAQLVNAETNEPFREHVGKKGEVYAEIEPDCEYFIRIQVVGGDQKRKRCFQVAVDGTMMESRTIANRKSGPAHIGMLSRENGIVVNKAFALRNPPVKYNGELKVDACMPIGSVTVRVSEAVHDGSPEPMDFKEGLGPPKDSVEVPYELGVFSGKKFLRTTEGTLSRITVTPERSVTTKGRKKKYSSYRAGALLQELNIHYCTALGLIHAGVLEKPPMWDLFRKQQNYGKRSLPLPRRPKPAKRIKVDAIYNGDTLIVPAKTIEVFDLTKGNLATTSDDGSSRGAAKLTTSHHNESYNGAFGGDEKQSEDDESASKDDQRSIPTSPISQDLEVAHICQDAMVFESRN